MNDNTKYFSVDLEVLRGTQSNAGEVYSDGEIADDSGADDIEIREIITGYTVREYDENGNRIGTEFYPVATDFSSWEDNHEEVLEKIKADYPAGEWQNDNW